MYCPQCNTLVEHTQLVCPTCSAHIAKIYQEQKLKAAKKNIEGSVRSSFLSPLFIIIASVISVLATLYLFVFFSVAFINIFFFLGGAAFFLVPAIFGILTTVSCWKIVASRNRPIEPTYVENVSTFLGVLKAYKVIITVIIAICGTAVFLMACGTFGAVPDLDYIDKVSGDYSMLLNGSAFALISIVWSIAFLMFLSINHSVTYGNAKLYVNAMNIGLDGGIIGVGMPPPIIRMFIYGTLELIFALFILSTGTQISIAFGLLQFFSAILLILLAIMFLINSKKTDRAVKIAEREEVILKDVREQTRLYIHSISNNGFSKPLYNQPSYQPIPPQYQQSAYPPQPPQYQQPPYQAPGYPNNIYPPQDPNQNYGQPTYQQNNYPYQ